MVRCSALNDTTGRRKASMFPIRTTLIRCRGQSLEPAYRLDRTARPAWRPRPKRRLHVVSSVSLHQRAAPLALPPLRPEVQIEMHSRNPFSVGNSLGDILILAAILLIQCLQRIPLWQFSSRSCSPQRPGDVRIQRYLKPGLNLE